MQTNERRTFPLDKTNKPKCGLDVTELTIIKTEEQEMEGSVASVAYRFSMVGFESTVYAKCAPGNLNRLLVGGKAAGCGIGRTLTQLCFNEDNIHNVKNNDENEALSTIRIMCKDMKSCDEKQRRMAHKLKIWAKSKCSKMVSLLMYATPKSAAHVYFNSALDQGYTQMFVSLDNKIYPEEGPCSVTVLKERYDNNGNMKEEDGELKNVYAKDWIFCYPKIPNSSKCTIL